MTVGEMVKLGSSCSKNEVFLKGLYHFQSALEDKCMNVLKRNWCMFCYGKRRCGENKF